MVKITKKAQNGDRVTVDKKGLYTRLSKYKTNDGDSVKLSLTKYNKSGNLLFIADKDSKTITVIDTNTKIILGNYTGHNGVIWYLDICDDSKTMISLSGDMSIIKWNLTNTSYKKMIVKSIPKYINIFKNFYVRLYKTSLTTCHIYTTTTT